MYKKQVRLFSWCKMINGNKNEAEKWKLDHKDTINIGPDLVMDKNILNIKCVLVQWRLYVLSNT